MSFWKKKESEKNFVIYSGSILGGYIGSIITGKPAKELHE